MGRTTVIMSQRAKVGTGVELLNQFFLFRYSSDHSPLSKHRLFSNTTFLFDRFEALKYLPWRRQAMSMYFLFLALIKYNWISLTNYCSHSATVCCCCCFCCCCCQHERAVENHSNCWWFEMPWTSCEVTLKPRAVGRSSGRHVVDFFVAVGSTCSVIDLRTAQVYWDAIFLVSQEVYLNCHHFYGYNCGWGGWGGDI